MRLLRYCIKIKKNADKNSQNCISVHIWNACAYYTDASTYWSAGHYGRVGFTRRDCWRAYVSILSRQTDRLVRRALCVLDFYPWKHFKFWWQKWFGILLVIAISMRPLDNRANLGLPSLRFQESILFSHFLLLFHADWISINIRFTCMTDVHAYTQLIYI